MSGCFGHRKLAMVGFGTSETPTQHEKKFTCRTQAFHAWLFWMKSRSPWLNYQRPLCGLFHLVKVDAGVILRSPAPQSKFFMSDYCLMFPSRIISSRLSLQINREEETTILSWPPHMTWAILSKSLVIGFYDHCAGDLGTLANSKETLARWMSCQSQSHLISLSLWQPLWTWLLIDKEQPQYELDSSTQSVDISNPVRSFKNPRFEDGGWWLRMLSVAWRERSFLRWSKTVETL